MPLNYVDLILLAVLGLLAVRGMLRGFVREVAGLIGLVAGLIIARIYSPQLAEALTPRLGEGAMLVAWIGLLLGGMLAVGLAAGLVKKLIGLACAGWLDHLLGLGVGALKGAVLASVLAYIIIWLFPSTASVKDSLAIPPLMDFVSWVGGSLNLNFPTL